MFVNSLIKEQSNISGKLLSDETMDLCRPHSAALLVLTWLVSINSIQSAYKNPV